jgi:hypothetical protein
VPGLASSLPVLCGPAVTAATSALQLPQRPGTCWVIARFARCQNRAPSTRSRPKHMCAPCEIMRFAECEPARYFRIVATASAPGRDRLRNRSQRPATKGPPKARASIRGNSDRLRARWTSMVAPCSHTATYCIRAASSQTIAIVARGHGSAALHASWRPAPHWFPERPVRPAV